MSVFKTKAIIIRIQKIKENDFLYTLLTFDYGVIIGHKKLSKSNIKPLDIGYIIHFEIITTHEKSEIHKMTNIKIISEFICENKTFEEIHQYLSLLKTIHKNIPSGVPQREIFEIIEKINIVSSQPFDISVKIMLAHYKILQLLGILSTSHTDATIKKILVFISQNKMDVLLRLTGIDTQTKEALYKLLGTY